jgi:hypothetical protein
MIVVKYFMIHTVERLKTIVVKYCMIHTVERLKTIVVKYCMIRTVERLKDVKYSMIRRSGTLFHPTASL